MLTVSLVCLFAATTLESNVNAISIGIVSSQGIVASSDDFRASSEPVIGDSRVFDQTTNTLLSKDEEACYVESLGLTGINIESEDEEFAVKMNNFQQAVENSPVIKAFCGDFPIFISYNFMDDLFEYN